MSSQGIPDSETELVQPKQVFIETKDKQHKQVSNEEVYEDTSRWMQNNITGIQILTVTGGGKQTPLKW